MLYNTHKRFGQIAGLGALPFLTESTFTTDTTSLLGLGAYAVTGYMGAKFGAEFPDIDSKGSKPSQKHPILRKIFEAFGVKHRGKFSHDFVVQFVFWAILIGLVNVPNLDGGLGFAQSLVSTYLVFTLIGVFSHLFADALTVDGVTFAFIKVHFMPVFIRKVNILGFKPFKKAFRTAKTWDGFNYKVTTALLPFVALATFATLFLH